MLKEIDWIKYALIAAMAVCVYVLLMRWDTYTENRDALLAEQQITSEAYTEISDLPTVQTPASADDLPSLINDRPDQTINLPVSTDLIKVVTDVLDVQINPVGGDIVSAKLLEHMVTAKSTDPYTLLTNEVGRTYIAKSGLLGVNGTDSADNRPTFLTSSTSYSLVEGQDQVIVDLVYQQDQTTITKRFTFKRHDYLIDIEYLIDNLSNESWAAAFYAQINRDDFIPEAGAGMGMNPYVGAAITTPEDRYKKLDFDDISEGRFQETVESGWVAILERFFLSAWIPEKGKAVSYDVRKSSTQEIYYIGFTQPVTVVAAGQTGSIKTGFYAGPKDQYVLRDIADHLDLTVDYGWLWWASQPLYAVLYFIQSGEIHSFDLDLKLFSGVVNWGLSIILLTFIVKLIFFPLSAASYKSMARMRKFTPKMTALREQYKDDKQALSQEMMKLYKKERINPLGGCLPMVVQMPIFLALYWVLLESVEIRHAPFIFWLQDLSTKDPLFILPLIMGASMFIQQKLNPTPPDPTQAKVMQLMPIMFTFMFLFFPSGLVLYWTVNNILSITQQWIITRNIEKGMTK